MASSLKEIKGRINSVNSTLKITSAMKMVASAKLHRAQRAIENMLPYEQRLNKILMNFLASGVKVKSPLTEQRKVEKVAIVALSSNTSLCGAFNSNVAKLLHEVVRGYKNQGIEVENVSICPIGRKITREVSKVKVNTFGQDLGIDFEALSGLPNYTDAASLANHLMRMFLSGQVDKVDLVYTHFKSTGVQELIHETYLPLDPTQGMDEGEELILTDYIVEPNPEEVTLQLLPKVLSQKIFTMLLDSNAAEHAARMTAMQIATDNANDLIQELTIMYNKGRQEAITNELLDIVGGMMGK